jgi:hypothetical protein
MTDTAAPEDPGPDAAVTAAADPDGLLARAGAALAAGQPARAVALAGRVLAARPGDPPAVRALLQAHRQSGDLDAARNAARMLLESGPPDLATANLLASLDGEPPPMVPPPGMLWPAPFARWTGAFDQVFRDRAFETALAALGAGRDSSFHAEAAGGGQRVDRSVRASRVADVPADLGDAFLARLSEILPEAARRLGFDAVPAGPVELQVTLHRDGDFYALHDDASGGPGLESRRISLLYYLHRRPRRFSGGDLRLYDGCTHLRLHRPEAFTRIDPADNSLCFFPSATWHEVTRVALDSDDPADGRLTLNGWLHAAS